MFIGCLAHSAPPKDEYLHYDQENNRLRFCGASEYAFDSRIRADNTVTRITLDPIYLFFTSIKNPEPDPNWSIPFQNKAIILEDNENDIYRVFAGSSAVSHFGNNSIGRVAGFHGAVHTVGIGDPGEAWGLYGEVMMIGSTNKNVGEAVGVKSRINPHSHGSGKIINAYGFKADLIPVNAGAQVNVENFYGFSVAASYPGAENFYGIYVDGTLKTPGKNYNFYSAGRESHNLFEGAVQIGSLSGDGNALVCVDSEGMLYRITLGGNGDTENPDIAEASKIIADAEKIKVNIRDAEPADTGFIYDLRPVIYNYQGREHEMNRCGLLPEEVASVCPEIVGYKRGLGPGSLSDASATETITRDIPVTVNYNEVIVPMLAEMQRLRRRVDELEERLTALQAMERSPIPGNDSPKTNRESERSL